MESWRRHRRTREAPAVIKWGAPHAADVSHDDVGTQEALTGWRLLPTFNSIDYLLRGIRAISMEGWAADHIAVTLVRLLNLESVEPRIRCPPRPPPVANTASGASTAVGKSGEVTTRPALPSVPLTHQPPHHR